MTGPSAIKNSRNFTFDDNNSSRPMSSRSSNAVASSSPITRENVISPSKMKQRSRKNGKNIKSPVAPTSIKIKASPRDSRDDGNGNRHPTTPRSTRASSSRRHSRSDSVDEPSSSRRAGPSTPRSTKNKISSKPRSSADRDGRSSSTRDPTEAGTAAAAQSVASAAAAALKPEEDSPRSKMQKKLFSNLRTPDPSLADLLSVLSDFEETSHLRRVNACGAIKTLTLHKANQIPLARTRGVVPSITSVLCDVNATEEERTRCINALMHLCVPEENWKIVYLFPQTPEALARNMADKYPQIRYAACLATSFLAKKNRKEVITNRLLMYAMARVLEVDKNGALDRMSGQDKKVFVGARLCVLKMLLHLSKNRDVSNTLARTDAVMSSLVNVASTMELAANILCIAILTNLTRHPDNAYYLVYKVPNLVPAFVSHIESTDIECAKCALYALQNLSCTGNCRQELANTPDLLGNVTKAAFRHDCAEQQLAALHTLKNLSDDPFNLVTMTNTPGCTATLLALANNDAAGGNGGIKKNNDGKNSNVMAQYLACDTLATLSHWLLTLSATRKSMKDGDGSSGGGVDMGRRTFKQLTWEGWN